MVSLVGRVFFSAVSVFFSFVLSKVATSAFPAQWSLWWGGCSSRLSLSSSASSCRRSPPLSRQACHSWLLVVGCLLYIATSSSLVSQTRSNGDQLNVIGR